MNTAPRSEHELRRLFDSRPLAPLRSRMNTGPRAEHPAEHELRVFEPRPLA